MTVVVTGGSAGIGRAVALEFARHGWNIGLIARAANALDSIGQEIEAHGAEFAIFPADVADAEAVFEAANRVVGRWGAIDAWINNAMVSLFAPIAQTTPEEFRRVTEATYLGYVHGTMAALRHMRPRNAGTIVQVGSALSYRAIPLQAAYCGAKFAIRGFTDALRSELRHDGSAIRITMLQLPAVNTPQFDWVRNKLGFRAQPLPPVHQPEPIAQLIYKAAQSAPRELWLGWPTLKAILANAAAPTLVDRYLASSGYAGQHTTEPQPSNPTDNLFVPAASGHATHGRFDQVARMHLVSFNPALLRLVGLIGSLGLAVAIVIMVA